MNTIIESIKKIVRSALFWAISVHFFIFFIVNYSLRNQETKLGSDSSVKGGLYKREISIQMSNGGGGKPSAKSNSLSKISTPAATISTNTAAAAATGTNENGSGSGSGTSFEETILFYQEPIYPLIAIKSSTEGKVKVRIKINPDGLPTESVILESSHHKLLDEAALKSIPTWRFKKRVASQDYFVEKTFVFKLNP